MSDKERIAELEAALEPFAKYGLYWQKNPFTCLMPDNCPVYGMPMMPTVGDFKKAAQLLPNTKLIINLSEVRKNTFGERIRKKP